MTSAAPVTVMPMHRDGLASHAYFDHEHAMQAVKLLPNEYFVTAKNMLLSTVLGSCVAACMRDPVAGIGGMNHFMLSATGPGVRGAKASCMRYGAYAMEMLLNTLLAHGARRERLETKVFGGGMVLTDMAATRVGEANADFVLDYLDTRNIRVCAQDLKGVCPRYVQYFPATGTVRVKRLKRPDNVFMQRETVRVQTAGTTQKKSGATTSTGISSGHAGGFYGDHT